MLDSGRARTYNQRHSPDVDQAVASCPVNCMYPVSYTELQEYETARDEGDGRSDHRHLGHRRGNTPLFVAGIDSDNNHRSSWYHTLKGKCIGKFTEARIVRILIEVLKTVRCKNEFGSFFSVPPEGVLRLP